MKKNSLIWRIFGTIVSFIVMCSLILCVRLLLLFQSDSKDLAVMISIPWAIGYFITKTFHSIFKNVWVLAAMELLVIATVIVITKLLAVVIVDIPANLQKDAIIVVVSFCISIIANNLDWTKDLFS